MPRVDLKKELQHLYGAGADIRVVDVPPLNFLMVDGAGDPNGSARYAQAVSALFTVSYTLKFTVKKAGGPDYGVMPLEGLWWADDLTAFLGDDRRSWRWTMMIMQPEIVTPELVQDALEGVGRRKTLPALARLRFESFTEGQAAQLLHTGPFSDEGPDIQRLHAFIAARGQLRGKHHEIYLSDLTRAAPERWRTIIRQPMEAEA